MEFFETIFSRERFKVYIEHLSLARKHIERAEKKRFMLVQEEIAGVERERSSKICMDRPNDVVPSCIVITDYRKAMQGV